METKIFNMNGTENGSMNLNDEIFSVVAHPQNINDIVKSQLNNERLGTVWTLTRSEVNGNVKKMFKQKGTGRARQGDIKSPLHIGGGIAFGPKPKTYDQRPPKKAVDKAIKGVLSLLAKEGEVRVVEGLEFASGKTKDVNKFMKALKLEKALIVVPQISEDTRRAVANFKSVKVVTPLNVNVVDLLNYGHVAINVEAVKTLQEALA